MIKTVRLWMIGLLFAGVVGGSFSAVAQPTTVSAEACKTRVMAFPTWYRGISETKGTDCEILPPGSQKGGQGVSKYIWTIALNIIEIALVLVGYIAVGFIIYGGFKYIVGAGASDQIAASKKIIINAVVGLVISLLSVGIINVIFSGFGLV